LALVVECSSLSGLTLLSSLCFIRLLSFNVFQLAVSFWSICLRPWYLECLCCGPDSLIAYTILVLLLWFVASFFDHTCSDFEIVKWIKMLQLLWAVFVQWCSRLSDSIYVNSATYWFRFCSGHFVLKLLLLSEFCCLLLIFNALICSCPIFLAMSFLIIFLVESLAFGHMRWLLNWK